MHELLGFVAQARIELSLPAILALVAGILILIWPRVLNYIVAIYLIAVGLIELFDLRI
ncbi:MAG TPA: DUF3096 domain-containing protein [Actinomycetota bacterium]|nr:DUF3096 domain-containing protein [Actinomycetota bacterium]